MAENSLLKLNNGNMIPIVGYGMWQINGEVGVDKIVAVIKEGYRYMIQHKLIRTKNVSEKLLIFASKKELLKDKICM